MHDVPHGLYVPYCLGSRLISPLAPRMSLGATAISAKFWKKKSSFQTTIFWYACAGGGLSRHRMNE